MKIILFVLNLMLLCAFTNTISAQKYAFINMEYILDKIPEYEMMHEQLDQLSKKWQVEIELIQQESEKMQKKYESELIFLSADMKLKWEEDILIKKQAAQKLKQKYFSANGEFYKRRDQLLKPILDEIHEALEAIVKDKGYQVVFDFYASSDKVIYSTPKIDISNEVLLKLGYY